MEWWTPAAWALSMQADTVTESQKHIKEEYPFLHLDTYFISCRKDKMCEFYSWSKTVTFDRWQ